jgi:hypothetical protein
MPPQLKVLFPVAVLALVTWRTALGQTTSAPRQTTPIVAPPAVPAITISGAATGASLRSYGPSNASIDLGPLTYFRGTSVPGETSQKAAGSMVISTRFALRVDCPGSSSSSRVRLTMSRLDATSSHVVSIDGTTVGFAAQTLIPSMPCGSAGEHRLDVKIPISTLAGSIGSSVAFAATLER